MDPEIDESIDWENAAAEEIEAASRGYVSPMMQRVTSTRITLELLRQEVPIVHEGNAAADTLRKATSRMGDATRARLAAKEQAGKDAKQRLYEAALPLIRVAAKRELARRHQWGSSATLDDLLQEATIGFLKGINSFKVEAIRRSPTNYLGQWILVEMRRASEALDHDMQVGHDAGEKFRRIRALRGRLITDLGREPTDEEIAEASRDSRYIVRPGFVGKAPADGETPAAGKGLTLTQIQEERRFRGRLGRATRFSGDEGDHDDDSAGTDLTRVNLLASSDLNGQVDDTPEDHVSAAAQTAFVAQLVSESLDIMQLPQVQRELISQRFGIPPFTETSAREIAKSSGIQREKVTRVLQAFQQEMTRPGGAFHQVISRHDKDDLYGAGLGWAVQALGPWKGPSRQASNPILTANLEPARPRRATAPKPAGKAPTSTDGVSAVYHCTFHGRTFTYLYPSARHAPKTLKCPVCNSDSPRIKTEPIPD